MVIVKPGEGVTGKVFDEAKPIVLNSKQELADLDIGESLEFERTPCTSVPIRLKGRVVGVLTVSDKKGDSPFFDESDLCLLAALGERIGVAFERATSYESARDQFVSAMVAMRSVLEARSAPAGKAAEHTGLVVGLGRAMGLTDEEVLFCIGVPIYHTRETAQTSAAGTCQVIAVGELCVGKGIEPGSAFGALVDIYAEFPRVAIVSLADDQVVEAVVVPVGQGRDGVAGDDYIGSICLDAFFGSEVELQFPGADLGRNGRDG